MQLMSRKAQGDNTQNININGVGRGICECPRASAAEDSTVVLYLFVLGLAEPNGNIIVESESSWSNSREGIPVA